VKNVGNLCVAAQEGRHNGTFHRIANAHRPQGDAAMWLIGRIAGREARIHSGGLCAGVALGII